MNRLLAVLLICSLVQNVRADESDDAIQEVQKQMQNAEAFKKATGGNSKEAQQTQQMVQKLSGNAQNEQDIYKLAADVLGNMKGQSPEEMAKILERAQKDPEAFASKFTPEQRKKLEEISNRIPASKNKKP